MDKKSKKKSVIKRKTGDENNMEVDGKKQKIIVSRSKLEDVNKADKVEVSINQAVEIPVQEQSHEIVHTGQLVEGNFDQPVFVNMKGEPVQLGPNTVIVYEQSGNPSNFAFGGMWSMDPSGRLVMAETLYDVKGEPEDESNNFVQAAPEQVEEPAPTYQQYELSNASAGTVDSQEYEVSIIDPHNDPENADQGSPESMQCMASTEEELATIGPSALRWLNQKYDYVVRKLQLNYDAGVKLLHSPTGCIQCVFFTTPSMQLAFNAVPQFLCIETGIEFTSSVPAQGGGTAASIRQSLCLFLAEDGNGRSVIVSAGISTFGDNVRWLLETFKSSNPAWRQVRCIVAEPSKHDQAIRASFPLPHCAGSVWQTCSRAARELLPLCRRAGHPCTAADLLTRLKLYALAVLRDDQPTHATQALRRGLLGPNAPARLIEAMLRADGPVSRLDTCLEGENYTNILHKGLERLTGKFSAFTRSPLQPDDFVTCFFEVAHSVEEERKNYALTRLRETEESKQSPTDTITQYAYNLMSHQTSLAQKCLDDRGGRRHSSAAICKYGTSTQECSCLFSKVFRLPCRHILMLTTELKVKTHIPFEPRWTVQHCLFGCETATSAATTPTSNTGATYMEQMVVEDNGQHRIQQAPPLQQVQTGLRQPQYVLAAPGQNAPAVGQVIFCNTSPVNAVQNAASHAQLGGQPVITSVVHTTQGGAVLTPTAGHDHA